MPITEMNQHGGVRAGAGRKKGSNSYGEPSKVMRVPESRIPQVKDWLHKLTEQKNNLNELHNQLEPILLPLFNTKVSAGFPSPADDYIEARLDLNEKLINNKEATFLLTVQGDSMMNVGIFDGSILVVDKSLPPTDGKIVIAALDGDLTVKRLSIKSTGTFLMPENDNYPVITITPETDLIIWGVVTANITQF